MRVSLSLSPEQGRPAHLATWMLELRLLLELDK